MKLERERYFGGFSSTSMRKGIAAGYGVYATNRRLIGIYDRLARPGHFFLGKPPGHNFTRLLAEQGEAALIKELERGKDMEVKWEEISNVEIRRPSWLRGGVS